MPASRALALEMRFGPALIPVLARIYGSLGKPDAEQIDAISEAFHALSKAIPADELAATFKSLCEECSVDGQPVVFDAVFSGPGGAALRYKVVRFVLEANYSDFFGELQAGLPGIKTQPEPSPA